MKLYARISLPFLLLAAYACGDDDTMGYKPSTGGQDATVTTDTGTTPVTDSGAVNADSATAADTGAVVTDTGVPDASIEIPGPDAAASPCTPANTFAVTNSGTSAYVFSRNGAAAQTNPALSLTTGEIYCFDLNVAGHPFWLKTVQGAGNANGIAGAVNNGAVSGTVVYRPAAAGTFFYNCEFHGSMTGTITVTGT